MPSYLIRVVLHGADTDHYTDLHERMGLIGARRTITGQDGEIFDLPDAEYRLDAGETYTEIRDRVCEIAEAVKARPDPSVMVTEFERIAWQLLRSPGDS